MRVIFEKVRRERERERQTERERERERKGGRERQNRARALYKSLKTNPREREGEGGRGRSSVVHSKVIFSSVSQLRRSTASGYLRRTEAVHNNKKVLSPCFYFAPEKKNCVQ
jgi:hypothetical protein